MGQQCSFCGTGPRTSSVNLDLENVKKKSNSKAPISNTEHSKENGHGGICDCPEPEWEEDSARPSGRKVKKASLPEEVYEASICATNEESMETIESFLVRGNPNAVNEDGSTILSLACENGFDKIVQIIMKKQNLHLNSKDHLGSTPLINAAWAGKIECARLLITIPHQCGLNIGATDNEGRTAMWWATQNHRFAIIDLLFEHHTHEQKDMERILIPAAKCNQSEWISRLLNPPYEVDPLIRNESGHSAFWYAVAYQSWEAAHILHQKIINKNNNNTNNNSSDNTSNVMQLDKSLCTAILMGQPIQLKQLLEEQQQQQTDKHFDELLLLAAESTSAQVVRILCRNHSYNTKALESARSIAATIGYEKTVEMFDFIINNHDLSDPSIDSVGAERQPCRCSRPYKGTLPATVWLAASNGQLPKVKTYVEKGGYINMMQETGDTLLTVACRYGHASILKYLLTRPDLHLNNLTTKWGGDYTALMVAAAKGHANIIQILATSNHLCAIDMDAIDGEGNSPLRLAVNEGEWESVECLLKVYSHHRKEDLEHAYSEAVEAEESETIKLLTSEPYNITS
ncbi:unnamed protein product [Meganyctiphanes norvegica]|uniref:Uncharacterized protein n=1 Tax=Meganyctiphanes norvegica TaxID=48144 RepID=A0AAV2QYP9_MEGNR